MKSLQLSPRERAVLAALAIFGLVVPNGIFIWYALTPPVLVEAALRNPIALVFIAEAFFLMFLFAWPIGRLGLRRPGRLAFIAMSLIGSMAFSVPAALWLAGRSKRTED